MLTTLIIYAIAYFPPIILKDGMGFSTAEAQCLIAPPYAFAAIVMYAFAWASDKHHIRSPFVIVSSVIALIGLPLLGFVDNVGARYFGVFLATAAANANVPCVLTWIGSTVFREQDKPGYMPGMTPCIFAGGLIVVISLIMDYKSACANKRAASGGKPIEGLEGFRCTL